MVQREFLEDVWKHVLKQRGREKHVEELAVRLEVLRDQLKNHRLKTDSFFGKEQTQELVIDVVLVEYKLQVFLQRVLIAKGRVHASQLLLEVRMVHVIEFIHERGMNIVSFD